MLPCSRTGQRVGIVVTSLGLELWLSSCLMWFCNIWLVYFSGVVTERALLFISEGGRDRGARSIAISLSLSLSHLIISSIPLLQGSLGHHRWFRNSVFPVLPCPLGLGELQVCPFPDVVFPPLPLSALSSSPFHCALQDGFGQTWWTGDMTMPLQVASLYHSEEVFVWSDCLLDLGMDFLVGNMVFVWGT